MTVGPIKLRRSTRSALVGYMLILPVLSMVIIYTVIDSFKVFDLVLVMTNGGPADSTSIMTFYIYKHAFKLNNFGYASAVAILLAIVILTFSIVYQNIQEEEGTERGRK